MATLVTKNSSTASAIPGTGDLIQGELAVNVTDKRLFTKDSGGTVVEVGTNPSSLVVAGNVGVGVTPSAWQVDWNVYQASRDAAFGGVDGGSVYGFMSVNAYADGSASPSTATWRYQLTGSLASKYEQTSGEHRWFTAGIGTAGNAISFTQAMTLDASGNLLVNRTAVVGSEKLSVNGGARLETFADIIGGAGTSELRLYQNTNNWSVRNSAGALAFYDLSGSAERARITSGGDFGINGTPPNDSQFYSKNSAAGKFAGTFENHDAGGYGISIGTANTDLAFFYPNASRTGSPVGAITTNGSSTSYVTSSDRRLKEGIAPAADAGPIIDAIEIVQHDWKVGGHTRFGVIAQDLNAVAPEAVSAGDDGDEIEKTWGVDYSKLVPMLIKEIQSLRARVAALESV